MESSFVFAAVAGGETPPVVWIAFFIVVGAVAIAALVTRKK